MADWTLPSLTSTYSDFLTFLKARDDDSAKMFDGVGTGLPLNTIRWNSTNNTFEKYNGTTWPVLTSNIQMTTNSLYNSAITAGTTINDSAAAATNILWTSAKINSFASGYVTTTALSTTLNNYLLKNGENGTLTLGTNDASAVNIETSNINRMSVSGTGNVTIAAPSAGVALTITPFAGSNALTSSGTLQGDRLVSTIATGTAPLTVTSTTKVTNLNADLLGGIRWDTMATASTIATRNASGSLEAKGFTVNNGLADGGDVQFVSAGSASISIDNLGGTLRVLDSGELFKVSSSTGNIWAKGQADLGGGTRTPWVELGSQDTNAETPFIDFHSGTTATDYDSRIIASGGTASIGGGTLTFQAASCAFPSGFNAVNANFTGTTNSGRHVATGQGSEYNTGGFEVDGNGATNTVFPTIGFHQPGLYASSLQLRADKDFRFYANGSATYANVTGAIFTGTSFNSVTALASATSPMNGTAAVGTSTTVARQDHVHPSDTSRAPLASPTFTGTPTLPTGTIAVTQTAGDNSTKVATTGYVEIMSINSKTSKAWVNFNAVPMTGTYSQTGTVVAITITAHGMVTGMIANLDFTSGTATDGIDFVVTVTGVNTFTVVGKTSVTTSGNVTMNCYIRSTSNVSSITDNGVGDFTITFTSAFSDTNYAVFGWARNEIADGYPRSFHANIANPKNTGSIRMFCSTGNAAALRDTPEISALFFSN